MVVLLLGLNHKTAPVEIREKLVFSKPQIKKQADYLNKIEHLGGFVILSTCNRTEFYVTTDSLEKGKEALLNFVAEYSNCPKDIISKYIYLKEDKEAVFHLFRVSAGLDSMILGESQILGQVQDAYDYAREYKISNGILNNLFQQTISVGKRVRTQTLIDRQAVSISSVAVDLAKELFGHLKGKSVLILGAGETSELTARHLVANGVSSVIVANRTYERASNLANEFGGEAIKLSEFPQHLANADIVISCTAAPRCIVCPEDLSPILKHRNGSPILFIDIAVPRDIHPDVGLLDNVSLFDVDDLQHVVQKNLGERKKEAKKAELIINEESTKFFKWLDTLFVVPTIVSLKEKSNAIKEKELSKALRRLGCLNEKEKRIVCSLANSIINQLLHEPFSQLKEYAHDSQKRVQYIEALNNLFNLDKKNYNDSLSDRELGRA